MPAPHEVIAAPLTVYLADVGTSFPDVGEPQASFPVGWTLLGTEGDRNYTDAGVTLDHGEEVFDFVPAGSTMASKRFRTAESFLLSLELADLSPTMYALAMNDATVTDPGDHKLFSLYRGDQVNAFAVIARGDSSVDNALTMQYEFSRAFVSVAGEITFNKGEVAALPIEIQAARYSASDVIQVRIEEV
jgi:hypothetical protein